MTQQWCSRCQREGVAFHRNRGRICVDCRLAQEALWGYFSRQRRRAEREKRRERVA